MGLVESWLRDDGEVFYLLEMPVSGHGTADDWVGEERLCVSWYHSIRLAVYSS